MKNKKLTITLLLILIGSASWLYFNTKSNTLKRENSDFAVKDTASITKLFLADKNNNTILLERVNAKTWTLNGKYEPREDLINLLLESICRVTVKAPVSKAAFETIIKNMAGSSTKVEIYQGGDKPVKVYYVGGSDQDHSGTYMLMENSSVPFLTHIEGFRGFLSPRYLASETDWRSTKLLSYNYGEIESVKVVHTTKSTDSFILSDEGNNHFSVKNLESGEVVTNYDTAKVYQYLSYFKKVHYEGGYFADDPVDIKIKDSLKSAVPKHIITVSDKRGKVVEIKTYQRKAPEEVNAFGDSLKYDVDRMYALVNNSYFVIIQYFVFDPITRKIDYFRKE